MRRILLIVACLFVLGGGVAYVGAGAQAPSGTPEAATVLCATPIASPVATPTGATPIASPVDLTGCATPIATPGS